MLNQFINLLTHPEAAMYPVATVLLYPVLALEALALLYIIFEFGRFSLEMLRRDRKRSITRIEEAAASARASLAAGKPEYAVEDLAHMNRNWLVGRFTKLLGAGTDLSRARLFKLVAETEMIATKFSTTVIGLLISGLAFIMSSTRERWYLNDVSDIEYALELLEV
jgi:Flp pilus assembly protein TadB